MGKAYKLGPLEWVVSGNDYTNLGILGGTTSDQHYMQVSVITTSEDTTGFRVSVTYEACGGVHIKTGYAQRKTNDSDPRPQWTSVWFKTSCRSTLRTLRIQEIKPEIEVDYSKSR